MIVLIGAYWLTASTSPLSETADAIREGRGEAENLAEREPGVPPLSWTVSGLGFVGVKPRDRALVRT
jgi:hypothetical protein